MKKEDVFSFIIYIAMIVIALVVGFAVLMPAFNNGYLFDGVGARIGYLIGTILISIILNAAFTEIGHLLGGLIGGYEILSVNILGLCFYKKEKEGTSARKFKYRSFDGLSGQTEICPKKENSKLAYYCLGPLVFFLIEIVAMFICIVLIPDTINSRPNDLNWLKYAFIILGTITCMFFLYDYYPSRLDSLNDGYRIVSFPKKVNIEAYNKYLYILGKGLITQENVELPIYEVTSDFTADTNLLSVYHDLIFEDYEGANKLLDEIIAAPKISKYTVLQAKQEKYFILLLTSDNLEELKTEYQKLFTKSDMSQIKKCQDMKSLRVYMLYEGLVENSKSEVRYSKERFNKVIKEEDRGFIETETILFNKAINRIDNFNKTATIE